MYTAKGAAFNFQIIPNRESAFHGRKMANEQPDHPARNAISSYFQSSEKQTNLEQESIDGAFEQKPRMTNNIAQYEARRIYLLSGKQTTI